MIRVVARQEGPPRKGKKSFLDFPFKYFSEYAPYPLGILAFCWQGSGTIYILYHLQGQ